MSTINTTNLKNPSSGSNNIVLGADGSTTIPTISATTITGTTVRGGVISGTAVASTSGVSIDFTGIPSWVKRITVMFDRVSTSGTSQLRARIGGSGGIETTGYFSNAGVVTGGYPGAAASDYDNNGFLLNYNSQTATDTVSGHAFLTNVSGNAWVLSGVIGVGGTARAQFIFSGSKSTSTVLDRVRITTVNGTDTFDAGSINILYEG